MDLSNEPDQKNQKHECNDILYLEGLFFIRQEAIKENTELVRNTLQDLYKTVTYN